MDLSKIIPLWNFFGISRGDRTNQQGKTVVSPYGRLEKILGLYMEVDGRGENIHMGDVLLPCLCDSQFG